MAFFFLFFFFFEILNTIEHNNILAQFKISNEPESFYQVSNDFSNLPDTISILYVYTCAACNIYIFVSIFINDCTCMYDSSTTFRIWKQIKKKKKEEEKRKGKNEERGGRV